MKQENYCCFLLLNSFNFWLKQCERSKKSLKGSDAS